MAFVHSHALQLGRDRATVDLRVDYLRAADPRLTGRIPDARLIGMQADRDAEGLACHLPFKQEIVGNA